MQDKNIIFKQAVEKYQCVGCVNGGDTKCGSYATDTYSQSCSNHSAGTYSSMQGKLYLGMPVGFNQVGFTTQDDIKNNIRLFDKNEVTDFFNVFNLPTWYQEIDGNLFVRTFIPRRGTSYIDIFLGGKAKDINVQSRGSAVGDVTSNAQNYQGIDINPFHKNID